MHFAAGYLSGTPFSARIGAGPDDEDSAVMRFVAVFVLLAMLAVPTSVILDKEGMTPVLISLASKQLETIRPIAERLLHPGARSRKPLPLTVDERQVSASSAAKVRAHVVAASTTGEHMRVATSQ